MPARVTVKGAEQWGALAKSLRTAPKELRREVYKGISRATKPIADDLKRSASSYVPDRYARELERTLRTRTRRRGGQNPGITFVASAKSRSGRSRELIKLNQGRLRHMNWGRPPWHDQNVKPGLADDVFDDNADEVRRELLKVMADVAKKISRLR